jgi:HAD superfamily hydrolase (TIGR01509 family)
MGRARAVIFDIDGTLVDSNDAHARAFVEAFAEQGVAVPIGKVRRLIGMGSDKLIPAATGVSYESDRGRSLADRKKEIFKEKYLRDLKPFPRVRELLEELRRRGLHLAAASSAEPDELKALLKIAGASDLLESRASSGDAEESKPDPDIVLAAVKKTGLGPAECLMVGDTPYDVEAAGRAGVPIVALRCGGWRDEDLRGTVAVYQDPADLLKNLDRLPLEAGNA